jgi:hypothetical protein
MRARVARIGAALAMAAMLGLLSASAAAAEPPAKGFWAAWYETKLMPAGTWAPSPEAGYGYLYSVNDQWTLPTPGSWVDNLPLGGGPFHVSNKAPIYKGTAIIRVGNIEAATSIVHGKPVCSKITTFNPKQRTRIIIGYVSDVGQSKADFLKTMNSHKIGATLSPAGGSKVLSLKRFNVEWVPSTGSVDPCRFTI